MKKLFYSSVVLLSLLIVSCAPDKKDDPTSPSNPTADSRDKFTGSWSGTENCASGINGGVGISSISKSSSLANSIVIDNFAGLTYSVYAVVDNSNFTIPYQQIGTVGYAKGSGTLTTASRIDMTYTTTVNTDRDSCSAVYTK